MFTGFLSGTAVTVINFLDFRILMVQSGQARPAGLIIKTIQEKAKGVIVKDWKTVKSVIEDAMREVRDSLTKGWNFTDDRLKTYLQFAQHCLLLIAAFSGGEPFLL